MRHEDDESDVVHGTPLGERVEAASEFAMIADRLLRVGELEWSAVEADYRLLAFNSALRRQLESVNAAILLSRNGLGHLAVALVRASLEDVMYLSFFSQLKLDESQELFLALGKWDSIRSLLAQRNYVGDDVMAQLWYPVSFLESAENERAKVKASLRRLQQIYRWSGGLLPSGDWIAERANQRDLYDYLHAATSRALHFSAGETLRRGWGHPLGVVVTDKREFREHLASFALDQLWRLYSETWKGAIPYLEPAGIGSDETLSWGEMQPILDRLLACGKVPLVHAHEWNMTPSGPLNLGLIREDQ